MYWVKGNLGGGTLGEALGSHHGSTNDGIIHRGESPRARVYILRGRGGMLWWGVHRGRHCRFTSRRRVFLLERLILKLGKIRRKIAEPAAGVVASSRVVKDGVGSEGGVRPKWVVKAEIGYRFWSRVEDAPELWRVEILRILFSRRRRT